MRDFTEDGRSKLTKGKMLQTGGKMHTSDRGLNFSLQTRGNMKTDGKMQSADQR